MDVQLDQLRALSAAVAEGTFDAAARRLRITPSALSQRVKALEAAAGRVLLHRTKPVRATESGRTMLRLARQIEVLTGDAAQELGADPAHGEPVRVPFVVNGDSLDTWVLPALTRLSPEVCFDIRREDQEHSTELLRNGTVMAAVTSTAEPVQGCTVKRLGYMRYRPMASPRFAATWFGSRVTVPALAAAPVVVFDRKDNLQDRYLRRRARRPLHPPRHHVPASAAFAEAIRLGLGWGMLPDIQVEGEEDAGALVSIDPGTYLDIPLYWQQWRLRSTALDGLAAAIEAAAADRLH